MSGQSVRLKSFSISSPTWFPATMAVAGTSTSTDVLINGTGTSYRSQVSPGDWLVNTSNNEVHKVAQVISDTQLELDVAFTTPLAGATVVKIKDKAIKYLKVVFINSGTVAGVTQAAGAAWPASIPWETPSYDDFIEPILVTPGAGGAGVIQGE